MSITTGAAVGIGIAGLASAGTSLASSLIAKGGAADATAAGIQGTREGIAAQERMAEKAAAIIREQNAIARGDLAPFRESELKARKGLEAFADPTNPVYQAQRARGTQAIQQQLAAQGLLRSKKQTDLLTDLELGLNQQQLNVLAGLAGGNAGQLYSGIAANEGSQLGNVYQNLGQTLGSSFGQIGQLRGQNAMTQANLTGGMISGVGNAIQGTVGNILANNQSVAQNLWLQELLKRNSGVIPIGNSTGASWTDFGNVA